MRVALFERSGGGPRIGVVDDEEVVDLTGWVGPLGCCPLAAYLARAAESAPPLSGERVPVTEVTWLPPARGAAALLCVGLNYADHAEEVKAVGLQAGEYPAVHSRYWPTVVGHRQPIQLGHHRLDVSALEREQADGHSGDPVHVEHVDGLEQVPQLELGA